MIQVLADRSLLRDDASLSRLLQSTPYPRSVPRLLRKGFFGRRWQQSESRDYWLLSDGVVVMLFTISGASAAQVSAIRLRFDDRAAKQPGLEPSQALLQEIASLVEGE